MTQQSLDPLKFTFEPGHLKNEKEQIRDSKISEISKESGFINPNDHASFFNMHNDSIYNQNQQNSLVQEYQDTNVKQSKM